MMDILYRLQESAMELDSMRLMIGSIISIGLGLVLWLGGMRFTTYLVGLLGGALGGIIGWQVSGWIDVYPLILVLCGAGLFALIAVLIQRAMIVLLAMVIFGLLTIGFYTGLSAGSHSWQDYLDQLNRETSDSVLNHHRLENSPDGPERPLESPAETGSRPFLDGFSINEVLTNLRDPCRPTLLDAPDKNRIAIPPTKAPQGDDDRWFSGSEEEMEYQAIRQRGYAFNDLKSTERAFLGQLQAMRDKLNDPQSNRHQRAVEKLKTLWAELRLFVQEHLFSVILLGIIGGAIGIIFAYHLMRIMMALCCSLVGTTGILGGVMGLCFAHQTPVISHFENNLKLLPIIMVAMVLFGWLAQTLLDNHDEKKEPSEQ